MRLFVAIDLDDDARQAIAVVQQRIMESGVRESVKTVNPAHMHLTLAFAGGIAEAAAPPIVAALSTDLGAPRFVAGFQGLGVFPPRGAPRLLWLGVGQGAREVVALQSEVAARLEGLGVMLERRPFHPHLTLARWRPSHPAGRERALLADSGAVVASVDVNHVTPYQSRLTPGGPVYTALTRANLA